MHRRFFVAALFAATALHPGLAQEPTATPPAVAALPADAPAYDVVVYSGVPCGVAASVAAAREGAKTLLIEPTKEVGGLNTSG